MGGGKTSQNQLVSKYSRQHYWRIKLVFVFVALNLFYSNLSFGQFKQASIIDYDRALAIAPWVINNDVLDDGNISYKVTAYTDASNNLVAGIMWEVYDLSTGTPVLISKEVKPLSNILSDQQVYDIDVCLVKDPFTGEVNALTVFSVYSESIPSFWGMEAFRWDNGANEFTPYLTTPGGNVVPTVKLDNGQVAGGIGTAIHIDANDLGEFIIVFDNEVGKVYGYAGYFNGNGILNIYNNGLNFYNTDPFFIDDGVSPDVSITSNINVLDPYIIYCTYIGTAGTNSGKLIVADSEFGFLKSPVPTFAFVINVIAAPALLPFPNEFETPRIASPKIDPSGMVTNKYTVVYNVIEGSSRFRFYIRGFTNNYGTVQTYNNGSIGSSLNITQIINSKPVVTYDLNDKVWVGWLINNTIGSSPNFPANVIPFNSATDAFFPIVVPCDEYGTTTSSDYWEVPYVGNNFGSNNAIGTFALSGRNSTSQKENYYSYFNSTPNVNGVTNLLTKSVNINGASSLKSFSKNEKNQGNLIEFLLTNSYQGSFNFLIFDSQGKLMYSLLGSTQDILTYINTDFQDLDDAIYLCNLYTSDGEISINEKLFPNK